MLAFHTMLPGGNDGAIRKGTSWSNLCPFHVRYYTTEVIDSQLSGMGIRRVQLGIHLASDPRNDVGHGFHTRLSSVPAELRGRS